MFHALEYTFVLKVEIICVYIACIVIGKLYTTEQSAYHVFLYEQFGYDVDYNSELRHNNVYFLVGIERWQAWTQLFPLKQQQLMT